MVLGRDLHPKISIIVPCFNVAPWIVECMESILSSSFKIFEVLCIDDGSTDDTWELMNRFATNPHVRLFRQENKGVSTARNVGLRALSGDYVMFVDGDDAIDSECLATLVDALGNATRPIDILSFRHRTLVEFANKPPAIEDAPATMIPCSSHSDVKNLLFKPLIGYSKKISKRGRQKERCPT